MTAVPQAVNDVPDPMPLAKLGMYFFLASEAMFFVGLLGSFLVLHAGQREIFHHMATMLSTWETGVLIALLVAAGAVILIDSLSAKSQLLAVVFAAVFCAFQLAICMHLLHHHTIVARADGRAWIYDGEISSTGQLTGVRTPLPAGFDVTRITITDIRQMPITAGEFQIVPTDVLQDVPFGPWRNNFFGCYFLIAATELLHVLVGILAMLWLAVRTARRTVKLANVECVTTYWQFVIITGILGLLLLFFA